MKLKLKLSEPINGFWDGGAKSEFTWSICGIPQKDNKGEFVKIGTWEGNSWFNVSVGKTEKMTLSNAKRHLIPILKKRGIEGVWSYID